LFNQLTFPELRLRQLSHVTKREPFRTAATGNITGQMTFLLPN